MPSDYKKAKGMAAGGKVDFSRRSVTIDQPTVITDRDPEGVRSTSTRVGASVPTKRGTLSVGASSRANRFRTDEPGYTKTKTDRSTGVDVTYRKRRSGVSVTGEVSDVTHPGRGVRLSIKKEF